MTDDLDEIPDAELLHEWGIGAYGGYTAADVAPVAASIRNVHRLERRWLHLEQRRSPDEPYDQVALAHLKRMQGDGR